MTQKERPSHPTRRNSYFRVILVSLILECIWVKRDWKLFSAETIDPRSAVRGVTPNEAIPYAVHFLDAVVEIPARDVMEPAIGDHEKGKVAIFLKKNGITILVRITGNRFTDTQFIDFGPRDFQPPVARVAVKLEFFHGII